MISHWQRPSRSPISTLAFSSAVALSPQPFPGGVWRHRQRSVHFFAPPSLISTLMSTSFFLFWVFFLLRAKLSVALWIMDSIVPGRRGGQSTSLAISYQSDLDPPQCNKDRRKWNQSDGRSWRPAWCPSVCPGFRNGCMGGVNHVFKWTCVSKPIEIDLTIGGILSCLVSKQDGFCHAWIEKQPQEQIQEKRFILKKMANWGSQGNKKTSLAIAAEWRQIT